MPRADDPRIVVRMSPAGYASIKAAADRAGVGLGAIMRVAAERYGSTIADEVVSGKLTLRRSSVPEAVTGPPAVVAPARSEAEEVAWTRQQRINAQTLRSRAGRKS